MNEEPRFWYTCRLGTVFVWLLPDFNVSSGWWKTLCFLLALGLDDFFASIGSAVPTHRVG